MILVNIVMMKSLLSLENVVLGVTHTVCVCVCVCQLVVWGWRSTRLETLTLTTAPTVSQNMALSHVRYTVSTYVYSYFV